jgi:Glyoxalase-like domain
MTILRTLGSLLLPLLATAADLKIDHATVCGADVKKMQAALAAVGIKSEYGGPHSNHASEMALTSFPDGSYLEQIAIQPQGDKKAIDTHEWSKQMKGNSGPCAWAVQTTNIGAESKRLQAGIAVGAPVRAGRNRPDGKRLDWETAQVGPQTRGTFFPFLIQDLTPRELRAYPSGKPTTTAYSGISKIVIAVRDLNAAVAQFRKVYFLGDGKASWDQSFGAHMVEFKGTPLVLAEPLPGSWLNGRLAAVGEGPCAIVLRSADHKEPQTPIAWFDTGLLGWRLGVE